MEDLQTEIQPDIKQSKQLEETVHRLVTKPEQLEELIRSWLGPGRRIVFSNALADTSDDLIGVYLSLHDGSQSASGDIPLETIDKLYPNLVNIAESYKDRRPNESWSDGFADEEWHNTFEAKLGASWNDTVGASEVSLTNAIYLALCYARSEVGEVTLEIQDREEFDAWYEGYDDIDRFYGKLVKIFYGYRHPVHGGGWGGEYVAMIDGASS